MDTNIFKAYDIRGIYPDQIDERGAFQIGLAFVEFLKPKTVVVGKDVRGSGEGLKSELIRGITELGVQVIDIGVISTDMLYFAVAHYGYDGGITISASHNPKEYNGMKMVGAEAKAISSDTGLFAIRDLALKNEKYPKTEKQGKVTEKEILDDYVEHVLSFIDVSKIKPFKIVLSSNFGPAGMVAQKILSKLGANLEISCLDCELNGEFPKGRPDPLIPERQKETSNLIEKFGADFGVAWDADADRCFFFDEKGNFIEGYFITALLAENLLKRNPGEKIIYDPRLTWATEEVIRQNKGIPILNKAGHTFIKDRMRQENALFAGEMSAHYYFRDNFYADNGMIPFLMILEMLSVTGKKMSELVAPFTSKYFVSGEINSEVADVKSVMEKIENLYKDGKILKIDGLSVEYSNWRFNLRPSNTEPLLRLNVEALSKELMEEKRDTLLKLIRE